MGWINNSKAENIQVAAQTAWANGDQFFTPVLNFPMFNAGFSGAVSAWPPMLSAIVGVGWKLHTWVVASDNNGRPQAMPLFVR